MARHAFVDESVGRSYLLVAVIIDASCVAEARQAIRGLLLRNQRRIHFRDERDRRRHGVLDVIGQLRVTARVYRTTSGRDARDVCLNAMLPDLIDQGVTRIVLERDESIALHDRKVLYGLTRKIGQHVEYQHLRAYEDLLLCLPDAVAWCVARGGRWGARVREYTTEIDAT